ncbi:LSU ribosomal protein L3p (L3e), partial [hydrothermal vent metagenome]
MIQCTVTVQNLEVVEVHGVDRYLSIITRATDLMVQSDPVQKFITQIKTELDKGYGFIPLLGAGLSAESGVPLIDEMKGNLAICVRRALGVFSDEEEEKKRRWYPKTDSWPKFSDLRGDEEENVRNLISIKLKSLREKDNYHPEISILQEALGALANWQSTLLFLSRLCKKEEDTKNIKDRPLRLGSPDYSVIDAFLLHATGGKRPTLPHQMLALLAQVMRFDALLSTNFDELIEKAFREAEVPLETVDVHIQTHLPSSRGTEKTRTLVKLHGGRYGLRADYSLDEDPTPEEFRNFDSYFYRDRTGKESTHARNHLLVIGVDANDRRIIELIKHAYAKGKDDQPIKVFWIYFAEDNPAKDLSKKIKNNRTEPKEKCNLCEERKSDCQCDCVFLHHKFTGLLLLQIWQSLTYTLPPRFAIFPSATRISTPPVCLTPEKLNLLDRRIKAGLDETGNQICKYVLSHFEGDLNTENRLLRLANEPGGYGVVSKGAHHYYRALSNFKKCVWLSLENVSGTDELFEYLTDALARAAGITDWMPVVIFNQKEKVISEINRLVEGRHQWVIFLDVRDGAGETMNSASAPKELDNPNGWLDKRKPYSKPTNNDAEEELDDGSRNADDFVHLLTQLAGKECPNINVVLMYHKTHLHLDDDDGTPLEYQGKGDATEGYERFPVTDKTGEIKHYLEAKKTVLEETLNAAGFPQAIEVKDGASHIETAVIQGDLSIASGDEKYSHNLASKNAIAWIKEGKAWNEEKRTFLAKKVGSKKKAVEIKKRAYFMLGLCCIQRTRYPAVLLSRAFHPPKNYDQKEDPKEDLKEDLKDISKDVDAWITDL